MALDKVRDLGTLVWELFSTARWRFRTMSQSSHAASSISQDSYFVQYALITVGLLLTPEVHLPLRSLSVESTTATLCCTSVAADGRECCCLSLVPCSTSRRFILSDVLHWLPAVTHHTDGYDNLTHPLHWTFILCNFWHPGILWRSALSVRVPGCQKFQMTA